MIKPYISKRYRISSSLAIDISKVKKVNSITTCIEFMSHKSKKTIRISPIILHLKERMITAYMAKENGPDINFSDVDAEWYEFIEATFKMIISVSSDKDLS